MKTSPDGVAFIAAHEGIVTRAYRDVGGTWTIGVGHTAAAGPPVPSRGMTITRQRAMELLAEDLPQYEARVAKALPGVPQHVFDGAVSFDFNTGAVGSAGWVKAFRAGRTAEARARLMQWTKAHGRDIPGLAARRLAEAELIFEGHYGAAPAPSDETYADKLAALGFSGEGAVLAFQKTHPDLVADGIAGPATRAAIDRDVAARAATRCLGVGGAIGGAAIAAGFPWWVPLVVLAAIAAVAAWHWRDELLRFGGLTRQDAGA
jgi:lysozyme